MYLQLEQARAARGALKLEARSGAESVPLAKEARSCSGNLAATSDALVVAAHAKTSTAHALVVGSSLAPLSSLFLEVRKRQAVAVHKVAFDVVDKVRHGIKTEVRLRHRESHGTCCEHSWDEDV